MKKNIDKHIKEYYENLQLDEVTKSRLISSINQNEKQKSFSLRVYQYFDELISYRKLFLTFTSIAAIILVYFGINNFLNQTEDNFSSAILYRVSKEIAMNHNKKLSPEFYSNSFSKLNTDMANLDFTIVEPSFYEESNYDLIGSRYCTIQGNIAAQLKLKDKEDNIYTLYQSAVTEELEKIKDKISERNGLIIKVWEEKGLFFGLASPVNIK